MKKPLSEITEEDAIEFAKIVKTYMETWENGYKYTISRGFNTRDWVLKQLNPNSINELPFYQYFFLESKGYEVPPNPYKGEPQQEQTAVNEGKRNQFALDFLTVLVNERHRVALERGFQSWNNLLQNLIGIRVDDAESLALNNSLKVFYEAYKQQQEAGIEQAIKALEEEKELCRKAWHASGMKTMSFSGYDMDYENRCFEKWYSSQNINNQPNQ